MFAHWRTAFVGAGIDALLLNDEFALFLACDAELAVNDISEFADYCLDRGVFWLSSWGPDCERVHDIFDTCDVERGLDERGVVMTTWHSDESLGDALDLFWDAFPDAQKQGGPVRLVIVVGERSWVREVETAARTRLEEDDRDSA